MSNSTSPLFTDDPDSLNEEEFTAYIRDRIGDIDFKQRTAECFMEFLDEAGRLILETPNTVTLKEAYTHQYYLTLNNLV